MSLRCLPLSFGLIWLMVLEEMSFEEFQDGCCGGHLGYWNETILAILNLCVTAMPPIKFWLNLTYGLWGEVVWKISKWPPWRPSWISKRNYFSNSESLCHCDASSHQVSAQSDLWFGRRCHLKIAILNLHVATIPPIKFQLNPTYGSGGECEKLMTDGRTNEGQQTMTLADLEQRSANKTNIRAQLFKANDVVS